MEAGSATTLFLLSLSPPHTLNAELMTTTLNTLLWLIILGFTASYKHMRLKILPLKEEDKTYLRVGGETFTVL